MCLLRIGRFVFVPRAGDQGVEGGFFWAEDQDDKGEEPEDERVGGDKFVGVREEAGERLTIGGDVGGGHVDEEAESGDAREQSEGEQDTADEFEAGDESGSEPRRGEAEALKKFGDVREVVKFSPSVLGDLPAPVEADSEEQRRLQAVSDAHEQGVKA